MRTTGTVPARLRRYAMALLCVLAPGQGGGVLMAGEAAPPEVTEAARSAEVPEAAPQRGAWSLERLIHETTAGNPQVLARRAEHRASEENVAAARWKLFPAPYVQVQRGNGNLQGSSYQQIEVYGFQQPIWTGGKLSGNLKLARAQEASSSMSLQETRLALAREVVDVYQSLLGWHYRMRAQDIGVRLMERYAGIIGRRADAGVSARIDQTQVQARLLRARNDLASSASSARVAMEQMRQLTGVPLRENEILFLTRTGMVTPPDPDSLLAQAEAVSPTLARLRAEVDVARHQRKIETASLFPSISMKAEQRNYRYANDRSTKESLVYASMEYSFGAGLSTFSTIRSASSKVEESRQSTEAARRNLRSKITADAEECSRSLVMHRDATLATKAASEVLSSYTRLFVAGKRNWLDVLNAAQELVQSSVAEGDLVASYWGSLYRLRLHAMDAALLDDGTGNEPKKAKAPAKSTAKAKVKAEPETKAEDEAQAKVREEAGAATGENGPMPEKSVP